MSSVPSWRAARELLCVRLDAVGDVLMTTPAIAALRKDQPQRRITLLTSSAGAALGPRLPDVDAVICHDVPWVRNDGEDRIDADLALIERLRTGRFDAAVIFTVYSQSALPAALLCRLAGIPLRLAHSRENPYRLLTDWVRDADWLQASSGLPVRHEVQRQLDLVARIDAHWADPRLRLGVLAQDREGFHAGAAAAGFDPRKPWILIHPGATAASRRYPPEQFARAARLLAQRSGLPLVLGGSAAEVPLVEAIRAQAGVATHTLAGALTLGEYAAAIDAATLLVSNNSAPVHIAAALGTPVVDLYALTNLQHTPWRVASRVLFHDVPCRNCYRSVCPEQHHACLRSIAPERVAAAATELLEETENATRERAFLSAPLWRAVEGTGHASARDASGRRGRDARDARSSA